MKARASVRLHFSNEKQLNAVIAALYPEAERQIGSRAKTKVTTEALCLMLDVEADDSVALRAALNAYLRWIDSTAKVLETVEKVHY